MQSLGGYTFYWNPDRMSIPEKQKMVSRVETYGGSAVFEWEAILQGTLVELWWNYMPKGMYKKLREMFLNVGTNYEWNPDIGGTRFSVKVVSLDGRYFETTLHDSSWRGDVKLKLDIRTVTVTMTTTTTTSTTTTV